jgi:hypothetical protein
MRFYAAIFLILLTFAVGGVLTIRQAKPTTRPAVEPTPTEAEQIRLNHEFDARLRKLECK